MNAILLSRVLVLITTMPSLVIIAACLRKLHLNIAVLVCAASLLVSEHYSLGQVQVHTWYTTFYGTVLVT